MATKAELEKEIAELKKHIDNLYEREGVLTKQLDRFTFQNNMMVKVLLDSPDKEHIIASLIDEGIGSPEIFEEMLSGFYDGSNIDTQELVYSMALEFLHKLEKRSKAPKVKQARVNNFWLPYQEYFNQLRLNSGRSQADDIRATMKKIITETDKTEQSLKYSTVYRHLVSNQK